MMRTATAAAVALLLLGAADAAKAVNHVRGQHFLGAKAEMRPDAVAKTLSKVEDEWNLQVASFAECNGSATTAEEASECGLAPRAFQRSCSTVVTAMVGGSSGDKANVAEYMGTVCGEDALAAEPWRQERCQLLSRAIVDGMSEDAYNNRESFDASELCAKFWTRVNAEENARLAKEQAEREAREKKEAEEREAQRKKEEEEAADAAKKAEEEAAAEKKRQEEEAAARAAEAAARRAADAEVPAVLVANATNAANGTNATNATAAAAAANATNATATAPAPAANATANQTA